MLFTQKYQPECIDDFYLDDKTREILDVLLKMDNLNILFVGDAGSGKTSIMHALLNEYYLNMTMNESLLSSTTDKDKQHKPVKNKYKHNILTINNLKDQGIHYYRNDVKQFCQTSSSIKNRKKSIIFDDIDFINEQSQQVFRNCIDKYSSKVHFIASCSNIQKIIEPLQSRFMIVKLKPFSKENLTRLFLKIKEVEKIKIDESASEFIIDVSQSSAKTLINYMEKIKLLNESLVTFDLAQKLCTNIHFSLFDNYIDCLFDKKLQPAIRILYDLFDNGYSVMDILDSFFVYVKTTKKLNEEQKYNFIPFICKYISIFYNIHEDEIELALFTNDIISL